MTRLKALLTFALFVLGTSVSLQAHAEVVVKETSKLIFLLDKDTDTLSVESKLDHQVFTFVEAYTNVEIVNDRAILTKLSGGGKFKAAEDLEFAGPSRRRRFAAMTGGLAVAVMSGMTGMGSIPAAGLGFLARQRMMPSARSGYFGLYMEQYKDDLKCEIDLTKEI